MPHAIWTRLRDARLAFAAVALLYILSPGHPSLPLSGVPIGPWGVAAATGILFVVLFGGRVPLGERGVRRVLGIGLTIILFKTGVGLLSPAEGWLAWYSPNGDFRAPHAVSTDFPGLDATRVDTRLAFQDDRFPVHFFNEASFNRGIRREVSEAFSARWRGHLIVTAEHDYTLTLTARGPARVRVDGHDVLAIGSGASPPGTPAHGVHTTSARVRPQQGRHLIEASYVKPPDTDGLMRLDVASDEGSGPADARITPRAYARWRLAAAAVLYGCGVLLHAAAALLLANAAWLLGRGWRRADGRAAAYARFGGMAEWGAFAGVFVLLAIQGFVRSRHLIGRMLSLTGGDDWLAFEARAREVLIRGPLMTFGAPLGEGDAFMYYPLYSYFLALVHRVVGEDLFGVIFVQFVVLFFATWIVHRIALAVFGRRIALIAVVPLVLIQQSAFVRWYTVTLLSENLYYLTVAACVLMVVRFVHRQRTADLVLAGAIGGASALTKPSMMLYLVPAIIVIALAVRPPRRAVGIARALGIFGISWFAVVSLATIRNYVVSGDPVLIVTGQAWSFIIYNLPDIPGSHQHYAARWGGSLWSTAMLLWDMLLTYPRHFLDGAYTKVMFSLGMVHWMGNNRPHLELAAVSVGYLASVLCSPAARSLPAFAVHAFVLTHLASMILTMPSNYGYRLILPMYLFMPMFATASAWRVWQRLAPRRAKADLQ
jgi:hypothetical protein